MGISSILSSLECVTFLSRDALFFSFRGSMGWNTSGVLALCRVVRVRPEEGMMDLRTGM